MKVLGRGTIVYDGPQDPNNDEGWMQKPDWHCIGTNDAHNIEVSGLTCVIRSRTWSIQMKDSSGFVYDDLRVMGGNPGNANQDGMDWIGSSDGIVRNSFFRASDDVIALMGNWDGYTDADMLRPGRDVHDITVENSQLSTSVSNIVRSGWPRKIFNSWNFTLRNSDILHAGIGACGELFGVLGFWGADGARGTHSNYTFENLFLDDWYSLLQMQQEQPGLRDFTFRNIWALDQPPLIDSSLRGDVTGVTLDNVKYGQAPAQSNADVPLLVLEAAAQPKYVAPSGTVASFTVDPPFFAPGDKVTFTAAESPHARYTWSFGDGTEAHGRKSGSIVLQMPMEPSFDGTDWRWTLARVLLHAEGPDNAQDWAAQSVVAVAHWHDAFSPAGPTTAGLAWRIYPGTWTELPDLSTQIAVFAGESSSIQEDPHGFTRYATTWDGYINIPADGGYTFHLLSRDGARLAIDGMQIAKTGQPFAQVCNTNGNAVRYDRGSIGLRAGLHAIHLEGLHFASQGTPRVLWEGPSLPLTDVPVLPSSHAKTRRRHYPKQSGRCWRRKRASNR